MEGHAALHVHALLVLEVLDGSVLNQTVEVDGHHALGAGGNRCGTHGVLVGGVVVTVFLLDLVAQTAAA